MIRNLWSWLQGHIVQDVPDSIAACEFDCRAVTCRRGSWERCPYHRWAQAVGLERRAPRLARPGGGAGGRAGGGHP
jgi:hypothetical protein